MSRMRVSGSRQRRAIWTIALACAPVLFSCGGDSTTGPAARPTVASVAVTPSSPVLDALGETVQLNAAARDDAGGTIPGTSFAWKSSDLAVATVSLTGLVTAVANGSASVSATADGISGSATVAVQGPTTGSVRFVIETVGRNLDPDGYSFVFNGSDTTDIGIDETVTVDDLDPGPVSAILLGLAPNCYRFSSQPISGSVVAGATMDVPIGVECLGIPDEISTAFVRGRSNPDSVNIVGLAPGSSVPIALTFNPALDRLPRWSPDGSMLAFIRDNLIKIVNTDGTGLRSIDYGMNLGWSPSGTRMVYDDGTNMFVIRLNVSGSKTEIGPGIAPAWSPDGSRIAAEVDVLGAEADIFVLNPDGTDRVNITQEPFLLDREPIWSPDGSQIAFRRLNRSEDVGYDIWVMDADGSNQTRLVSLPGAQGPTSWLPDGRILFWSDGSIMEYRPEGAGTVTEVVEGGADFSYWDPTWRSTP